MKIVPLLDGGVNIYLDKNKTNLLFRGLENVQEVDLINLGCTDEEAILIASLYEAIYFAQYETLLKVPEYN